MEIQAVPPEVAVGMTCLHYIMCFDAGNAAGISGLFDPHYGRINVGGRIYAGRDVIQKYYWELFCSYANEQQTAKLSLLPDSLYPESEGVFVENGKGTTRVWERISAQIGNRIAAADIMIVEHAFTFTTFFANQPRLDASDKIYLPILHLIVPTPTPRKAMRISEAIA